MVLSVVMYSRVVARFWFYCKAGIQGWRRTISKCSSKVNKNSINVVVVALMPIFVNKLGSIMHYGLFVVLKLTAA